MPRLTRTVARVKSYETCASGAERDQRPFGSSWLGNHPLEGHAQIVRLTLAPPDGADEWVGPAFSRVTYARWGAEAAEQLRERFGEPARERPARTTRD